MTKYLDWALENVNLALKMDPSHHAAIELLQNIETEKKMLQNIVEAERTARNNYSIRAKQADELGEVGLANHLEDMADDESGHLDETLKILQGWE